MRTPSGNKPKTWGDHNIYTVKRAAVQVSETRIPGMVSCSNSKYASLCPVFVIFTTRFAINPTANTPMCITCVKDYAFNKINKQSSQKKKKKKSEWMNVMKKYKT
jgi:hypothetical protein